MRVSPRWPVGGGQRAAYGMAGGHGKAVGRRASGVGSAAAVGRLVVNIVWCPRPQRSANQLVAGGFCHGVAAGGRSGGSGYVGRSATAARREWTGDIEGPRLGQLQSVRREGAEVVRPGSWAQRAAVAACDIPCLGLPLASRPGDRGTVEAARRLRAQPCGRGVAACRRHEGKRERGRMGRPTNRCIVVRL